MVIWQASAQADITEILNFIAADNPVAAARIVRKLREAGDSLSMFPGRGRVGQQAGTRELTVVRPYTLVYELEPTGNVTILRVWHAAQSRRPNA